MDTTFDSVPSPLPRRVATRSSGPRHGFRTFLFAALIALIPFVGGGASAIYVAHRRKPEYFELGEACGAAFISLLSAFGFFVGLSVLYVIAAAVLAAVA